MSELKDFRGLGPPADIGVFQFPASVIVYQYTFSGTTYVVAARRGDRGWVLVAYLPLSNANNLAVINAALAALSAGRTWQELVCVMGNYSIGGTLLPASYTIFEVQGRLTRGNNINVPLILVSAVSDVTLEGGFYDGAKAAQTTEEDVIRFENSSLITVELVKVTGALYTAVTPFTYGNNITFMNCTRSTICFCTSYDADYDDLRLRGGSTHCQLVENRLWGSSNSCCIQLSTTGTDHNVILDNVIDVPGGYCGIRVHRPDYCIVADNHIYKSSGTTMDGIELVDNAIGNIVENNQVYGGYIQTRQATGGEQPQNNSISRNYIVPPAGGETAINLNVGWDNKLEFNTIIGNADGLSIGINIAAACLRVVLHRNDFLGTWGTRVVNASTTTIYDTLILPFVDGTESITAAGAPKGWLVDAANEFAITYGVLPLHCHQLMQVKIWGVGKAAPGAGNGMRLILGVYSGQSDETWNSEDVTATKTSNELGSAVNDIISWTFTSADDPDLGHMVEGEHFETKVVYAAASAPHIASNVLLRCIEFQYI